jgi:hypothetical protein
MQTIHQVTARFPTVDESGKERLVIETTEFNREKDGHAWQPKAGTQTYWQDGSPVQKQADGSFVLTRSKKVLRPAVPA